MTSCDIKGCSNAATHIVTLALAGEVEEIWQVCRLHDQQLKLAAVRSRPKAQPPVEESMASVQCGQCRRTLNEQESLTEGDRRPCPNCGSRARARAVGVTDTMQIAEPVRLRTKRQGKGGWLVDIKDGDDYTRDLEAWGRRELVKDREQDRYREVIELYDGSRIVSTAKLTDHQNLQPPQGPKRR